ncbi:MAG: rRNA maturation RNase YbeY [Deltaproteobacteria bacterium CG11_big_fil_rev_8_21_14_0_20_47_16]|nr:MAG: rRNA maturation RNase YbeY [Deltaproteobacteria bacterium CG11_big_fil_rev_8_21_14_0_20_47_16]
MVKVEWSGFSKALQLAMKKVVPFTPKQLRRITVAAVSDAEMKVLNQQYRKKNKTTDVLTFVYDAHNADIYMSLAVAKRQAKERNVTLMQECQRLFVHGISHAAGMDHHTPSDFEAMRKFEFEVLIQCVTV